MAIVHSNMLHGKCCSGWTEGLTDRRTDARTGDNIRRHKWQARVKTLDPTILTQSPTQKGIFQWYKQNGCTMKQSMAKAVQMALLWIGSLPFKPPYIDGVVWNSNGLIKESQWWVTLNIYNKAVREQQHPSAHRSENGQPINGPTGWQM